MLLPPFESFTPLNVILSATFLTVLTFIVNTFDNHIVLQCQRETKGFDEGLNRIENLSDSIG
ncbi:hypothetical protein HMPREF1076_02927 [Parabacteroides goldsteinii CL02T12C30]|uniref:Uncharacterized protein n=1 Tax=Parabacteroides goldsteinii CL02T12C30 TaxID=999418 RepID=K5ZS72_9BACT|nr:hypothetical protein HMPREF1076_02927 [Parabacteroides goldsteinii CL02T12C30]